MGKQAAPRSLGYAGRNEELFMPMMPSRYAQPLSAVRRLAVLVAALVGLGGCHGGPRTAQERAAAVPAHADEFATLGYRVEWRGFPTMMPRAKVVGFDLLGDAVGVLDTSGVFTALEARGGQ